MSLLLCFALALAGFVALALSLDRHYEDLLGKPSTRVLEWSFRGIGWPLIAASLAAAVYRDGLAVGMVLWAGLLTLAALTVALLMTYRGTWRRRWNPS